MSLLEKLEKAKFVSNDHPDVAFLKNSELGSVVNRGLAELYKIQPKNPVTFLANWLLNESRSKEIKKKIKEDNELKEDLKQLYEEKKKVLEKEKARKEEEREKETRKKDDFVERIKSYNDIEANLDNICEDLKTLVNATGVYISTFDFKRKIPVTEEEDETAHLLPDKVIRYINFCKDHQLLKNQILEPGTGVTYDLYVPKEDNPDAGANMDMGVDVSANDAGVVKAEDLLPMHKLVEEVIREPRMKFFREPRLGCYFAIDMSYNSSLYPNSLLSAMVNLEEYKQNLNAEEQRRKEWEERMAELQKDKDKSGDVSGDAGVNNDAGLDGADQNMDVYVEEKIELKEFEKMERKIILHLDTLGQDRIFTEEEKKFIFETVKVLKTSWEGLETRLLLKDRDLKIEMNNIDKHLNETFTVEKLEAEEEKFIKEYFQSEKFIENPITDERIKAIETDYQKTRIIINSFFDDENIHKSFLMFAEFEFVEFEKLFQNTLYFVGISNLDINEENTNKLDWKKARKLWNVSVLEKLRSYDPIGPKSEKPLPFSLGHRLIVNLSRLDGRREDLRAYSFTLYRLLDFLQLILKVRRDDIIRRRDVITELMEKKTIAEAKRDERLMEREKELEKARAASVDEDGNPVEFKEEEEFLKKWDEENPEIEIPPEVTYDVDADMDLELLA